MYHMYVCVCIYTYSWYIHACIRCMNIFAYWSCWYMCLCTYAYRERILNYWFHEHPIFWIHVCKNLMSWCWKWIGIIQTQAFGVAGTNSTVTLWIYRIYRGSGCAESRPCGCIWSSTKVGEQCSNMEDVKGLASFVWEFNMIWFPPPGHKMGIYDLLRQGV